MFKNQPISNPGISRDFDKIDGWFSDNIRHPCFSTMKNTPLSYLGGSIFFPMDKKPFIIYKSSAGSGKTYTLTLEYLKLALANPGAFRQILAVTFTNKATAEMKERIVKELVRLRTTVNPAEKKWMRN